METALEIQQTLKSYHEALLLHSGVVTLPAPATTTLAAFKRFFAPREGLTRLRKESSTILDDEADLVALVTPSSPDRLTAFILEHFAWLFVTNKPMPQGTAHIHARTLSRVVALLSTLLAAILLVGAVVALNYAPSQNIRMALLAASTAGFAGTVALLTSARRAEVFAATAAYVAVLVVFIGGSGSSCNGSKNEN